MNFVLMPNQVFSHFKYNHSLLCVSFGKWHFSTVSFQRMRLINHTIKIQCNCLVNLDQLVEILHYIYKGLMFELRLSHLSIKFSNLTISTLLVYQNIFSCILELDNNSSNNNRIIVPNSFQPLYR
jgi:hypothetical protein